MLRAKMASVIVGIIYFCSSVTIGMSQTAPQATGRITLTAAGSGVNLAITRLLAEAFMKDHPHVLIEIPGSIGSQGAISAVADGAITLGLISRPLKDKEKALGLVEKPYARVAMVIGSHPTVKEDDITSTDLIGILKGTKTRWSDGNDIIVQVREKFDSGFQILQKEIPGFSEAYLESLEAKRWSVYFTDQDANRALSMTPFAIGLTDYGMITAEKLNIKVLKFNGVFPSLQNMGNGTYPLIRQLQFAYLDGKLPDEAKAFLDFVFSEKGRVILQANNYLQVK